ncbi:hypothetical protein RB195_017024 [Necator americanus]|uniref:Uncharacterized protein n=1 Tax=Necator americanus TaxID=51031 RepID=A0ABR1C492_NECAM
MTTNFWQFLDRIRFPKYEWDEDDDCYSHDEDNRRCWADLNELQTCFDTFWFIICPSIAACYKCCVRICVISRSASLRLCYH